MSEKQKRPKATLELDGKEYVLQHPGNRAWLKHYQTSIGATEPDVVAFMDWAFEHVVFPKKGGQLSLDTLPIGMQRVWMPLLLNFLNRGELDAEHSWKDIVGEGLVIAKGEGDDEGAGESGSPLDDVAGGAKGSDDQG